MNRTTALDLIRRMDINAELLAAGRPGTAVDLHHTTELFAAARDEDRATDPGSAGAATKTAGRPGAQPRRSGGAR